MINILIFLSYILDILLLRVYSAFARDGKGRRPQRRKTMNNDYAAGLAVGIIVAILILGIIWKFNKNKMKGNFDERQELVRGRGYKYACFTLLGLLTFDLLLESFRAFETLPVTRELFLFFILIVGIMVYALYCVKNDSYFGVGMDTRTYRAVMWIVIVCNAISAVSGLMNGGAMVDGKLAFGPWAALIFVIAFIILMISLKVRSRSAALEETEEDEE